MTIHADGRDDVLRKITKGIDRAVDIMGTPTTRDFIHSYMTLRGSWGVRRALMVAKVGEYKAYIIDTRNNERSREVVDAIKRGIRTTDDPTGAIQITVKPIRDADRGEALSASHIDGRIQAARERAGRIELAIDRTGEFVLRAIEREFGEAFDDARRDLLIRVGRTVAALENNPKITGSDLSEAAGYITADLTEQKNLSRDLSV